MMKIKRFLAIVSALLSVAMVLPMFGCNTSPNGGTDATPKPTEVPEPTPEPRSIADETSLASSVVYAADLLNGIQGYYDSPDREGFTVQNLNSRAAITLKGGDGRGLSSLMNANGVPLVSGGITGYVKTADGFVFGTTSSATARVNTNMMGVYYYQINIRDLGFDTIDAQVDTYETVSAFDVDNASIGGNNITQTDVKDGAITFTVESSSDPYLVVGRKQELNGANAISFDITVSGNSTSGELFYIYDAGSNYTQDQKRSFKISEGGNSGNS